MNTSEEQDTQQAAPTAMSEICIPIFDVHIRVHSLQ